MRWTQRCGLNTGPLGFTVGLDNSCGCSCNEVTIMLIKLAIGSQFF